MYLKKGLLLIFIFLSNYSFAQDLATEFMNKGLQYYNMQIRYNDSQNLSLFLASRYFKLSQSYGNTDAGVYLKKLERQGYIMTDLSYSASLKSKAEQGDARSIIALAECYQFEFGVLPDDVKDYHARQRIIADLYSKGYSAMASDPTITTNERMAAFLLRFIFNFYDYQLLQTMNIKREAYVEGMVNTANKSDYSPLITEYAILLSNPTYKNHNDKKCIKMLTKASEKGNRLACLILANAYNNGTLGLIRDSNKAEYYGKKSLE